MPAGHVLTRGEATRRADVQRWAVRILRIENYNMLGELDDREAGRRKTAAGSQENPCHLARRLLPAPLIDPACS